MQETAYTISVFFHFVTQMAITVHDTLLIYQMPKGQHANIHGYHICIIMYTISVLPNTLQDHEYM